MQITFGLYFVVWFGKFVNILRDCQHAPIQFIKLMKKLLARNFKIEI